MDLLCLLKTFEGFFPLSPPFPSPFTIIFGSLKAEQLDLAYFLTSWSVTYLPLHTQIQPNASAEGGFACNLGRGEVRNVHSGEGGNEDFIVIFKEAT